MNKKKIGIAFGSGSARGWAHIGVLRALAERGIVADVAAGTSVGALVGAVHTSGQLDPFEEWVRSLSRVDVWRLLDAKFKNGGVFLGTRLFGAIEDLLNDPRIEDLSRPFGAVATDLRTGEEVWMREGPMLRAARASCGVPGVFAPVFLNGRWLTDGGLVNPIPVSLCRALGADKVIAINLNADLTENTKRPPEDRSGDDQEEHQAMGAELDGRRWPVRWLHDDHSGSSNGKESAPGMLQVMGSAISIMQDQITRGRLRVDVPDLVVAPRLPDLELFDFHLADEAIAAGRESVAAIGDDLDRFMEGVAKDPA